MPTGPPAPVEPTAPRPQPRVVEQPEPKEEAPEAQLEEQLRFVDKLYFGGNFGLQFGTFTNISLLPTLNYAVTPKFYTGVGGVYHFQSGGGGHSLHHYGGRGFLQLEMFNIGDGTVLAHGEVEALNIARADLGRTTLSIPMVGLGYRQRFSKGFFDLLVLYNGNSDFYNPYNNPVIRAGFNIPFTSR
ncbi:hypothetical protein FJM65_18165 [Pontibacter mangrovi]|uniref:Outer membrane protein beta-barrel domain-containing protein n=1 Tax=Pontibacter mangrovi TaxID=2589816 RepID=A0A501W6U5_9BACT|nr:hypothetical protein FJM65_18165 [Pontibacter mangrovi]